MAEIADGKVPPSPQQIIQNSTVSALIALGRAKENENENRQHPQIAVAAADQKTAFPHALCAVVLDSAKFGTRIIATAAAIAVLDVRDATILYSKAFKVCQTKTPKDLRELSNMQFRDVVAIVKNHEESRGYHFVDRDPSSHTLSAVRRAIISVARECGCGCYSRECAELGILMSVETNRFPAAAENNLGVRTKDILSDAAALAKIVRAALPKT